MSIESTLQRVAVLTQELADPAVMLSARTAASGGTEAPAAGSTSFASALKQAGESATSAAPESATATAAALSPADAQEPSEESAVSGAAAALPGASTSSLGSVYQLQGVAGSSALSASSGPGQRIVAIAESQIGQTEQPPGSNESPAIAEYRSATSGAAPGAPWCAYFASWVARQAGEPIGAEGQGLGSVSEVWSWAQETGRAIANGPGVVPKPGDLIVFGDQHVGIVRDVLPNGQIQTIEGNYENKVAANVRSPTEATGYVEMS